MYYMLFLLDNNKAVKVVIELLNSNLDYDRQCFNASEVFFYFYFNNSFIKTSATT